MFLLPFAWSFKRLQNSRSGKIHQAGGNLHHQWMLWIGISGSNLPTSTIFKVALPAKKWQFYQRNWCVLRTFELCHLYDLYVQVMVQNPTVEIFSTHSNKMRLKFTSFRSRPMGCVATELWHLGDWFQDYAWTFGVLKSSVYTDFFEPKKTGNTSFASSASGLHL